VLLGLRFDLPSAVNGVKVEARGALHHDVVGRVVMFALTHLIDLASSYPFLRRPYLGVGRVVMQYDREVVPAPSLTVLVLSSLPDLEWTARWCCSPPGVSIGGSNDGLTMPANK
jgi:hypothetical protein